MTQRLEWLQSEKDLKHYLFAQVLGNLAEVAYNQNFETGRKIDIDRMVNLAYDIAIKATEKLITESNTQED